MRLLGLLSPSGAGKAPPQHRRRSRDLVRGMRQAGGVVSWSGSDAVRAPVPAGRLRPSARHPPRRTTVFKTVMYPRSSAPWFDLRAISAPRRSPSSTSSLASVADSRVGADDGGAGVAAPPPDPPLGTPRRSWNTRDVSGRRAMCRPWRSSGSGREDESVGQCSENVAEYRKTTSGLLRSSGHRLRQRRGAAACPSPWSSMRRAS